MQPRWACTALKESVSPEWRVGDADYEAYKRSHESQQDVSNTKDADAVNDGTLYQNLCSSLSAMQVLHKPFSY